MQSFGRNPAWKSEFADGDATLRRRKPRWRSVKRALRIRPIEKPEITSGSAPKITPLGLEPRQRESKSLVLPLHHGVADFVDITGKMGK